VSYRSGPAVSHRGVGQCRIDSRLRILYNPLAIECDWVDTLIAVYDEYEPTIPS